MKEEYLESVLGMDLDQDKSLQLLALLGSFTCKIFCYLKTECLIISFCHRLVYLLSNEVASIITRIVKHLTIGLKNSIVILSPQKFDY